MHEMRQIFRRGGEKTLYPLWDTLKGKSEILCEMRRENECGCRSEGGRDCDGKGNGKDETGEYEKDKENLYCCGGCADSDIAGKNSGSAAIELYGRLPCGRGLCGCL